MSAEYNFTIAGINPTASELIQGINDMFVAETALGSNYWIVSVFDSANKQLELKRGGSPAGVLGTFRALLFGGGLPHANAIFSAMQPSAVARLYTGVAEAAGTTGPSTLYTAGAPYTSGQKYSGGVPWLTYTNIIAATVPKLLIVECDRMCCILIKTGTNIAHIVFGEIMERLVDNVGIWACYGSIDTHVTATLLDDITGSGASSFPIVASAALAVPSGAYYDGTAQRCVSRVGGGSGVPTNSAFNSSVVGVLWPVLMGERAVTALSVPTLFSQLRQLRYGPADVGKKRIYNGASVLQGYSINGEGLTIGNGVIFDNSP